MRYRLEVIPFPEEGKDYPERIVLGEGEVPDELIPVWLERGRVALENTPSPTNNEH